MKLFRYIFTVIMTLGFGFVLLKTFLPYYQISTGSMEPTFHKGTIIFVSPHYYKIFPLRRNDIVLFKPNEVITLKGLSSHRVVAVEGDRVIVKDQTVFVNGEKALFPVLSNGENSEIIVSSGKVFQKGDRSYNSYGIVDQDMIVGKVLLYF